MQYLKFFQVDQIKVVYKSFPMINFGLIMSKKKKKCQQYQSRVKDNLIQCFNSKKISIISKRSSRHSRYSSKFFMATDFLVINPNFFQYSFIYQPVNPIYFSFILLPFVFEIFQILLLTTINYDITSYYQSWQDFKPLACLTHISHFLNNSHLQENSMGVKVTLHSSRLLAFSLKLTVSNSPTAEHSQHKVLPISKSISQQLILKQSIATIETMSPHTFKIVFMKGPSLHNTPTMPQLSTPITVRSKLSKHQHVSNPAFQRWEQV